MAALPIKQELATVAAMRKWWETKLQRNSRRLGASQIGNECERALWYGFRWVTAGSNGFDGRMLRLFNRGHREEPVFIEELRGAGIKVWDIDPTTGEQFVFTAASGHFVAKIDGVAQGVLEAPKAFHILSFKTAKDDSWKALNKAGAEKGEPKYFAQNQIEMKLAEIDRTLFLSANKNDDQIHGERIRADATVQAALLDKAERVIFASEPTPGISTDAAFYKCKFCPAASVCHGQVLPAVNCRTCLHSTPERDGDGRWSCALAPAGESIPAEFQARGCSSHLFVPALLSKWGAAYDASEQEGWVAYKAADGFVFRNAITSSPGHFTSTELKAATPALLRDPAFMAIRDGHGGVIVAKEAA